jgi:hypothetical protein
MMAQVKVTYEEVAKLAEQLTREEQQALIAHLQGIAQERKLSDHEWNSLIDSVKVSIPPGPYFSDKRSDWYDEDGR